MILFYFFAVERPCLANPSILQKDLLLHFIECSNGKRTNLVSDSLIKLFLPPYKDLVCWRENHTSRRRELNILRLAYCKAHPLPSPFPAEKWLLPGLCLLVKHVTKAVRTSCVLVGTFQRQKQYKPDLLRPKYHSSP